MRAFMGIDVGSNGSAALFTEDGSLKVLRFGKCTDKDIWEWIRDCAFEYDCTCIIEKVWAMPATNPDGSKRTMGTQTMFEFGENNGMVKAFITAAGIPVDFKIPQTWQKFYGMKKDKGEDQAAYKRRLKMKAEELFPNFKFTLDNTDGVLIANYCRKTLDLPNGKDN